MTLTREQILSKRLDLPREEVDAPGLGGTVLVWAVTAGERGRFEQTAEALRKAGRWLEECRARVVVLTVRDGEGKPLFADADVALLSDLPAGALDPVIAAAMRLNGMGPGDVEDARKN